MEKREMLKYKQLMIWARTGYWVTQSSLDEVFISDDEIILEQIESLKELKKKYPKLAKDINSDLFELMTNQNATTIKAYNEQYVTGMRNNVEEEYINILYFLSIFENSGLTQKQKDLLIDIVSGYSYTGDAKNFDFLCKKLEKSKGGKCMSDNKRKFSAEEMRKLFPNFYSKPEEYFDEYLNYSKKLDVYIKEVEESKRKGDYYRQLSLQYSVYPLELEYDEQLQKYYESLN